MKANIISEKKLKELSESLDAWDKERKKNHNIFNDVIDSVIYYVEKIEIKNTLKTPCKN